MITYEVTVTKNTTVWMLDGHVHREDGPAIECADGTQYWFRNGARHREDGPAVTHADGSKYWYQNGKIHREDGPAVEYANGDRRWYLNDKMIMEYEFDARMNPPKELTVADIEKLLGYSVKIVK